MLIAIEYSPNGLCIGYEKNGKYMERSFCLPVIDKKGNSLFNEIVTANGEKELPRTKSFFEQCLNEVIPSYGQYGNKLVFLRLQNCSDETENAYETTAYNVGVKYGDIMFLDKIDAMAAYAIKNSIQGKVYLISLDYGLNLCSADILNKAEQSELRKINTKSCQFKYTSAELAKKALSITTGVSCIDGSKLKPSLSEIAGIISSEEKRADIECWLNSQSEGIELLSFNYDGIAYKLSVKDVFDAYDDFSNELGALSSDFSKDITPVVFCGLSFVSPIVKYIISKELNQGVTSNIFVQSCENFALWGSMDIASGRTSFFYEFEYDIGIKAFVFDSTSDNEVVVKPIYVPLISRGELSAQYTKRKIFDNIDIKVEDSNENLVLYRNDKMNRIIEMPVMLLSKIAKEGGALKVGFEVVGRELFFIVLNEKSKQLLSLPLSSLFVTSAPSISIKQ